MRACSMNSALGKNRRSSFRRDSMPSDMGIALSLVIRPACRFFKRSKADTRAGWPRLSHHEPYVVLLRVPALLTLALCALACSTSNGEPADGGADRVSDVADGSRADAARHDAADGAIDE